MVKAFWKLQEVNAGFQPEQLLTMRLSLPTVSYKDAVRDPRLLWEPWRRS